MLHHVVLHFAYIFAASFITIYPASAIADYQWQAPFTVASPNDWQNYIRSPPSRIVEPAGIVPHLTRGNVTNLDGFINGKGSTILTRQVPDYTGEGPAVASVPPAFVVDFGQNLAGYLSIEYAGAHNTTAGLPGIRLAFSETLEYLSDVSDFSRSYNGETITPGSDQIAVQTKPYTWTDSYGCVYDTQVCSDGLHGFRYVKVYLEALDDDAPYTSSYGQVSIKSMSLNFTGFLGTAETFTGWFESSDKDLNQWWYDAVYTNDLCIDTLRANDTDPRNAASPSLIGKLVLLDGAKRDRDPYTGDLAVAARTAYLTHDAADAARNVLADLADHQRIDGWIPPASINNYSLPLIDYPLWWVTCSYDLLMHTNDLAYAKTYYSHLLLVLDRFYPSMTSNTTSLLTKGLGISGGYGDYAFLPRTGPVTYYNALYVLALSNAASIASYLGHYDDARRWSARADVVADAINIYLFDFAVGAFFDGSCGGELDFCPTHAQDGNSLAIIAGVTSLSRSTSILSYLSFAHTRPWGNSFYDNDVLSAGFSQRVYPFMSYFEISARFETGDADSALEEIRRLYGWMAAKQSGGTFWEGIGDNGGLYEGGYTSLAHGWASGIVPATVNYVLGVKPTMPGFAKWSVKPYTGDLEWARGVVPTPEGEVKVAWVSDGAEEGGLRWLSVMAPGGTSGEVVLWIGTGVGRGSNMGMGMGKKVSVDDVIVFDASAGGVVMSAWDAKYNSTTGFLSVSVEGGGEHVFIVEMDVLRERDELSEEL